MFRHAILTLALVSSGLLLPAGASYAQAEPGACSVGPQGQGDTKNPDGQAPPSGTLTRKLDSCNSVLTPPAVGDGDIVAPAPQTGEMPVISPDDVPQSGNATPQP